MIAHNLLSASSLASLSAALREAAPAIANHLWQSTAFAAAAGLLTLTLRNNAARTRHWIWLAASLKFLLPFALLSGLAAHFARPTPASQAPAVYYAVEDFSEPFAVPPVVAAAAPIAVRETIDLRDWAAIAAAAIWLAGFLTASIVWAARWRRIARAVRAAEILQGGREVKMLRELEQAGGLRRPMRMVLAESAMEPGVFGMMRPALIWPAGISERLDAAHLEAVLAHEVCHVRRRDNLLAALHMLVQAVFWFHPLVWWMGARLVAERERACDEAVLELCGRPHIYAESILKVCEFCVESPLACVAGITGADLKRRIVEIMQARALLRLTWAKRALIAAAMVCAVAVPFAMAQANSVRAAQRMMLAAINGAPRPVQSAAKAMMDQEQVQAAEADTSTRAAEGDVKPFRFDVVSIRPADPDDPSRRMIGFQFTDDGFVATNQPLVVTLLFQYQPELQLDSSRIVGGPDWMRTVRWNINAKVTESEIPEWKAVSHAPGEAARKRRQATVAAMLADRFKLKTHFETRESTVFELVVAKGGPRMKRSSSDEPPHMDLGKGGPGHLSVQRAEIAALAPFFAQELGHPVIDKTGLTGKYDLTLEWAPSHGAPAASSGGAESGDPSAPSLFTAVEEQLGLRLAPQKGPVEHLVIDSAEKPTVDGAEAIPAGSQSDAARLMSVAMVQQGGAASAPTSKSMTEFEAASVRQSDVRSEMRRQQMDGYQPPPTSNLFSENDFLRIYIEFAYGSQFSDDQDRSIYQELEKAHLNQMKFDIEARAEGRPTEQQLRQMVRSLLEDRFKLRAHYETRQEPIYALVLNTPGKLGPMLHAASEERPCVKPGDGVAPASANQSGTLYCGGTQIGRSPDFVYSVTMAAVPISRFADVITRLGHLAGGLFPFQVVDETGIKGNYDLRLEFAPSPQPDHPDTSVPGPGSPTLTEALKRQLGLRLLRTIGPQNFLVIDHVEMPTAN